MVDHPNDPHRGVPLAELIKSHGPNFKAQVDKRDWFDERAKPRKKKVEEHQFEPDPNIKDAE